MAGEYVSIMEPIGFSRRATRARMDAQARLTKWAGFEWDGYSLLKKLLGKPDGKHFLRDMTEDDVRVCELLCGAHGYAVYKMLLIKRGLA